ncbi:MAG: sigma-70 family RNA polymerase sigma factor [Erysipelotrichaceae bacterium]|nr:sigma-70 family RNA polymerase sigma factor [Erysipelotrichaceae bacterium]
MENIKRQLVMLKREKGYIDYGDLDEIIRSRDLSDDQINELIVWITQNDLNLVINEPESVMSSSADISIYPLLSRDEEIQLAQRIRKGDPLARDRFIKANLRLVGQQAARFSSDFLTANDLFQEGYIGLTKAVDRYDPELNVPFASYAVYWIRKSIIEAINKGQLIRIPQQIYEQLERIDKVIEEYQQTNNTSPTNEFIAEKLSISVRRVEELQSYRINMSSLDDRSKSLWKHLSYDLADPFARERLYDLLNSLPQRHRQIMELYFGLNGGPEMNMQQIAEKMDLSKQRISQIISKSIEYMKENYDK